MQGADANCDQPMGFEESTVPINRPVPFPKKLTPCVKRGRPDEDEGEEEKEGVAAKRTHIDDKAGGEEDLEVFTNQKEEEVVRPYSWFSSIRKRLWGQEEEEEF